MHNATTNNGQRHDGDSRHQRFTAPSMRAYITLIGAAALSGAALHMVRSTTAAELRDMLAQHLTLPSDLAQSAIDTSLQPIGL
jgi:hypothetical protein